MVFSGATTSSYRLARTVTGKNGTDWGDSANLVSVLVRPMDDNNWSYNNGQIEVQDLSGRAQARISSPGFYIVVTGPDKDRVATLARNLQVLY